MRRAATIVALLGGLVSVVGVCGGNAARPTKTESPATAWPPAALLPRSFATTAPKPPAEPPAEPAARPALPSPLPSAEGPTRAARHTFTENPPAPSLQAWVAVPVATLWNQPGFARPVDRPVVQPQPEVSRWLSSMNLAQKLDLDSRMTTQALMDDPLTVIEVSGAWADVLVQDQTGSVYPVGVEGWMPTSQITYQPPPPASTYATVSVPVANAADAGTGLALSYGTRLPVLSSSPTGAGYLVATPYGARTVPASEARTTSPAPNGTAVLQEAEKFLGLPYLWAGTSGYGFDCSGLTYAVYKQFGVTLARDAGDQAAQGRPVPRNQLQPGDLMFFADSTGIHHVGVYAGNGLMLHAPQTGSRVQLINIWSTPLARQFVGARRYLG